MIEGYVSRSGDNQSLQAYIQSRFVDVKSDMLSNTKFSKGFSHFLF
jgi:hypothetical protein